MRIFISYGHDEYIAFARQLAIAFKERNYEVWFDENYLKGGVLWEEYIEKGLQWVAQDENGRMILVMTPHSVRRPDGYCLNELAYALDLHLPVLPIMLVWTTPPLSIYRYQWIDLTHSAKTTTTFETDFVKIIEAIESKDEYQDENRGRIERLLEPLDYSSDISYYLPSFIGRQWFFEDFEQWMRDENASRIYFLTGLPGIGKTAIAIKTIQQYNNIAAYHLIRRGDSEKTSLRRAICSIAFQLSKQLPDYFELLSRIDIYRELNRCNDPALFEALITNPLLACNNRNEPVVIVIDAMDESISSFSSEFALFIANVIGKLPKWVRFFLTSRPEDAVLLPLQAYHPHILNPASVENNNDIRTYIEKRLQENYGDNVAIDLDAIVKKSEGIFLYTKYVCDEMLPNDISDFDPDNLPVGIGSVYYDFFTRNYPDIKSYRQAVRPVLDILSVQVEPLSVEMLAECINREADDIEDFLNDFHVFFTLDTSRRIRPFHSSLIDWLSDKKLSGSFAVKAENGRTIIAEWQYKLFETSRWNFFNDSFTGECLEIWLPEILEKTEAVHFDGSVLLSSYLKQLGDKSILHDLVSNRRRFHFIKSVLTYVFRQSGFTSEMFEDTITQSGIEISNSHIDGLRYLFDFAKTGVSTIPPRKARQPDYYYFIYVQIPWLYVQSSYDTDYIFKSLSQGLIAAYDDGRICNVNYILGDIYRLTINSFIDQSEVAIKYLKRVADYMIEDNWDEGKWSEQVLNCAKAIVERKKSIKMDDHNFREHSTEIERKK